jgi:hypothetical protein
MMGENQQYIALNLWAVLAPAIMLALLTIGVNLVADSYVRMLGRSAGPAAGTGPRSRGRAARVLAGTRPTLTSSAEGTDLALGEEQR